MPLYEYVCSECRARFERYVRAWGEAVTCPGCRSDAVEKQLSSFAMGASSGETGPRGGGGACCGGGCGCAR